jgi:hypothetical protein
MLGGIREEGAMHELQCRGAVSSTREREREREREISTRGGDRERE